MFENRVLRKIFGPKREEIRGDWRELHNEELHDLYFSNIIRLTIRSRMRWAGYMVRMGENRNAYKVLAEKLKRQEPRGRSKRRWKNNIKMDPKEKGWEGRD
jgi:hypothetical protein